MGRVLVSIVGRLIHFLRLLYSVATVCGIATHWHGGGKCRVERLLMHPCLENALVGTIWHRDTDFQSGFNRTEKARRALSRLDNRNTVRAPARSSS